MLFALHKHAIKLPNYSSFFAQGDQHSDDINWEEDDDANMLALEFSTEIAESK